MKKFFMQSIAIPKKILNHFFKSQGYLSSFVAFALLCALTFYYGSLYHFNPLDSSWITTTIPETEPTNAFGSQGAWLSSFVFYFFGLSAWIFPLPLFYIFCALFKKEEPLIFLSRLILGWILLLCSSLFFLSYYKNYVVINQINFLAGGASGFFLSDWLIVRWGVKGSTALASITLVYSLLLSFNLNYVFGNLGNYFKDLLKTRYQAVKDFLSIKFSKIEKDLKPKQVKPTVKTEERPVKIFRKLSKESLKQIFQLNNLSYNKTGSEEKEIAKLIVKTLAEFSVDGTIVDYTKGPSLTIYNFTPAEGVRQAKVLNLIDDLALALKAHAIIIKPSKNKRALEIQVPNSSPTPVFLGNIINSDVFRKRSSPLTLAFGVSEKGEPICEDLKEMPHILIAGSTGTGKSVCLNSFICSILSKASPDMVRFIMIDPKMLELSIYDKIPHMLAPVITTDLNKATAALKWAVYEMERRYEILQKMEVKSLFDYNKKIKNETYHPEEGDEGEPYEKLPYVVLIIDELADLMLMASKDIEQLIQRLSQKARACGIHLILATQRPSVDVVTGVIKANLPCRLSFRVVSRYDSRTILDQTDAEKLLGKGDMFFMKPGNLSLQRIQGAYISTEEVASLVENLVVDDNPYDAEVVKWIDRNTEQGKSIVNLEHSTDLYSSAKNIGKQYGTVSTSFLQRQLKVGYNKAADLIERLEQDGLISKAEGSKKRKWIAE